MQMPLLTPAKCSVYPKKPGFDLCEDYLFWCDIGQLVVPKGFWFDGASIPALFWQITFSPFDPRVLTGALVHDWLYTSKQTSREGADKTLSKYLLYGGAGSFRTGVVEKAVRLCGESSWVDTQQDRQYVDVLKQRIRQFGGNPHMYGL